MRYNNKSTCSAFAHFAAGLCYLIKGSKLHSALFAPKEDTQKFEMFVVKQVCVSQTQQELSYLLLEKDNNCNYSNTQNLSHKGREKTHIQGFYNSPHNIQEDDSQKNTDCSSTPYKPVYIKNEQSYNKYINDVYKLYVNNFKHIQKNLLNKLKVKNYCRNYNPMEGKLSGRKTL